MSYEDFNRKHTALPRYKRLCERTIKVTMDGQMLAPRRTKLEYHYRLFGDLQEILQYEHDRLLEIEEAMDSLRDLQEFRQQNTFQPVKETAQKELKPVKKPTTHPGNTTAHEGYHRSYVVTFPRTSQKPNSNACLTFWIFIIRFIFERIYNDNHDNRQDFLESPDQSLITKQQQQQ